MDRLFLILEFLHGRKHAQQIIADMLEEEGNKYLADRVRSRKQGGRKMLQLALEVIPYQLGVRVGIEFFEHAISFGRPVADFDLPFQFLKNWINEHELDSDEPIEGCELEFNAILSGLRSIEDWEVYQRITNSPRRSSNGNDLPGFYGFQPAFFSLLEMLEAGNAVIIAKTTGDLPKARRRTNRLHNALVKCANNCRLLPEPLTGRLRPKDLQPYENRARHSAVHGQMDWQWNHLVQTIQDRIG